MFKNIKIFFLIIIITINVFIGKTHSRTSDHTYNWSVIRTLHFDIFYPETMRDVGIFAAKAAEESYVYLANQFKHELSLNVPIVIHSRKPNTGRHISGRIDLAFAGSYRLLHTDLTRRMTHAFQHDILFGSLPGWDNVSRSGFSGIPAFITEGMAEYLSAGYDETSDAKIRKIIYSDKAELLINIKLLKNVRGKLACTIGQSFFYFLETSFGQDVISKLMLNIRDYDDIYVAITKTTGSSIEELKAKLIEYYLKKEHSIPEKNTREPENKDKEKNIFRIKYDEDRNILRIFNNNSEKNVGEIKLPFINVSDTHISNDGKYLAFIGQSFNSSDVYIYDIKNRSLFRVTNDRFEKRSPEISSDGNSVIFSSNENEQRNIKSGIFKLIRFDLTTKSKTVISNNGNEVPDTQYNRVKYPAAYFDAKDAVFSDYNDELNLDFTGQGGGVVLHKNFAGFVNIKAADILKMHKFEFDAEYVKSKSNNDLNYYFNYELLKYRADIGIDAFYKASPLNSGFSSDYLNSTGDTLTFYSNNINSKNYGLNGYIVFPFTDNSFFKVKYCSGIYENVNSTEDNYRKNIYSKEISLSFNYDGLIYNKAWPANGAKGGLSFSEGIDAGKRDPSFSVLSLNFLKLLEYNNIVIFSVKGSAGKIFGRDEGYFNYYIGGLNSVRGHGLFAYRGRNAFALNTEIRFVLIDRLILRWPGIIKFEDIGFALFADFGSAWNKDYNLRNSDTGEFEDLKSGLGAGLRFLLQDHLVFKVDAVWPYFYNSFGKREIISGFELRY
ncbi:MAG: BamA/TamA family outer membrane protein [Spirochaetota bacterium]